MNFTGIGHPDQTNENGVQIDNIKITNGFEGPSFYTPNNIGNRIVVHNGTTGFASGNNQNSVHTNFVAS